MFRHDGIFGFVYTCLDILTDFFGDINLSFWSTRYSHKTYWAFLAAFCGGTIVFNALTERWFTKKWS